MIRSEVRQSTINQLIEKARDRKYGKYVAAINLDFLRGFRDQRVSFDFPVTAIIGPNGGGKTTVMGAAGIIYRLVPPSRFFAKGGKYDDTMQDWKITYELIDREQNKSSSISRTASFRRRRWNRDSLTRDVLVFGVNRTVPATEKNEFRRFATGTFEVPQKDEKGFAETVVESVSRILGKDISDFKELFVDEKGKITLLTGKASNGSTYSEFHFGAGESSVIRMVAQIEAAQVNALVLIEEIENGLHPVATVKLVDYLIDAAKRKSIQVIFTTHSDAALVPLPNRAVWVATQERLFQGKMDIDSLRAITGKIDKKLAIFVEDQFAKTWVEALLRVNAPETLNQFEIHGLEGDGNAVNMTKSHNANPAIETKAIAIIDGDSQQIDDPTQSVFRLPGEMPEPYVFDRIVERWPEIGGKITVQLLQPFEAEQRVKSICDDLRLSNMDEHLLFAQLGQKLGFIPETTVQMAFANTWSEAYRDEVSQIVAAVKAALVSAQETAP